VKALDNIKKIQKELVGVGRALLPIPQTGRIREIDVELPHLDSARKQRGTVGHPP